MIVMSIIQLHCCTINGSFDHVKVVFSNNIMITEWREVKPVTWKRCNWYCSKLQCLQCVWKPHIMGRHNAMDVHIWQGYSISFLCFSFIWCKLQISNYAGNCVYKCVKETNITVKTSSSMQLCMVVSLSMFLLMPKYQCCVNIVTNSYKLLWGCHNLKSLCHCISIVKLYVIMSFLHHYVILVGGTLWTFCVHQSFGDVVSLVFVLLLCAYVTSFPSCHQVVFLCHNITILRINLVSLCCRFASLY